MPNIVFWLTMCDLDNVKQRLKLLYDRNDEHRLDVGALRMLVYVPVADIPVTKQFFLVPNVTIFFKFQRAFELLSRKLREKESQAIMLLPRLDKYYVSGVYKTNNKI